MQDVLEAVHAKKPYEYPASALRGRDVFEQSCCIQPTELRDREREGIMIRTKGDEIM